MERKVYCCRGRESAEVGWLVLLDILLVLGVGGR